MIIDFHTHCFPERIAETAITKIYNGLAQKGFAVTPRYRGSLDGLIADMDKCGVDVSVVLGIATNPRQNRSVNDFAMQINGSHGGRIIGFGSIHPALEDYHDELRRIAGEGIKGIKFHPFYQDMFVDGDEMLRIYERAAELDLVMLFHTGFDGAYSDDDRASPERIARIARIFPEASLVAAHLGGRNYINRTLEHLAGTDVYLDTSFIYNCESAAQIRKIIAKHDPSRLLFGSDNPWANAAAQLEFFGGLIEDKTQYEMFAHDNAARLLRI